MTDQPASRTSRRGRLRDNLILYSILLVLIPAAFIGLFTIFQVRNSTIQLYFRELETIASLKGDAVREWLESTEYAMDIIAYGGATADLLNSFGQAAQTGQIDLAQQAELNESLASYIEISEIHSDEVNVDASDEETRTALTEFIVYTPAGDVIAASDPNQIGKVVSRQPYFTASLTPGEEGHLVHPPFTDLATGSLTMFTTRPIEANGQIVLVLAGRLSLDELNEIMTERAALGETGETYLISSNNNYFLTPSRFGGISSNRSYSSTGIEAGLRGESGQGIYPDYRGLPVLGVYSYVPELQAAFLTEIDEAEANILFQQIALVIAGTTALAAVAAIVVAFAYANRFSQPIIRLTDVATRLASGDLQQRAKVNVNNEIGTLAGAFNQMANQLQEFIATLDARVQARTRDLATTVEVGRLVTSIYNQDEMMPQLVEFIRSKFNIYYAQIYLLDDAKRFANLRAGSGDVGRQLLARLHRLDMLETSLVSTAVRTGQAVVVPDTARNPNHKPNPLLPLTRSEVAVPLIVGQDILGVLDMQAVDPNTFNDENASVFQAMANQIASTLQTAQAFDEAQIAVYRSEEVNRRLTENNWGEYLGTLNQRGRVGYEYDLESPEWLDTGKMDAIQDANAAVPIVVGGQEIGRIVVKDPDGRTTFGEQEQALIADISGRVAQSLEQFRAFDEVRRAEATIREALKQVQDVRFALDQHSIVAITDVRGIINYVNDRFCEVSKYSREELIGQDHGIVNSGYHDKEYIRDMWRTIANGKVWHGEFLNRAKDGSLYWVDSTIVPTLGEDGKPKQYVALRTEITEQKMQMAAIEQSRLRAEQVSNINAALSQAANVEDILTAVASLAEEYNVGYSSISFIDQSEDGHILRSTAVAVRTGDGTNVPLTGYTTSTPDEVPLLRLIDQQPNQLIVIDDIQSSPLIDEQTRAYLEQVGALAAVIMPLRSAQGWVGTLTFSWSTAQNFFPNMLDLMSAIMPTASAVLEANRQAQETARRAAELETVAQVSAATTTLLELQELLHAVVELTKERFDLYHAHIYLLDETGDFLNLAAGAGEPGRLMLERGHRIPFDREHSLVARSARERQGIIANDITQEPDFLPNPLLPETRAELSLPLIVGERLLGVLDMQSTEAGRFTDQDVRLKNALADQVAVAIQNSLAFAEQQQIAERLREVDKLKSQFLANMSHELRTPLNSIIGYAEVLMDGIDGDLTEEAVEDVQAIHSGGKHLLTIINDILDLAKIEAGQMYMSRGEAKLEPVLNEVMNNLTVLAEKRGISLNLEIEPGLPAVYGDPIRLKQIAYNLVNNAIKFTEQGSVSVFASLKNANRVEIRIVDTGIGMSDQDIAGLFQQFHQVDGSPTRRAGGTGLGLVITKHLVEMHEGNIVVTSEKGVGSVFSFTLPVFTVPQPEMA